MHIAIAGNIGAGKTTLTRLLAKRYGWTPHYEPVDNNPYLEDYYGDMERWSFNLQIYFLNKRFRDVVAIAKSEETVIQDRTIFEDARIDYLRGLGERYEEWIKTYQGPMIIVDGDKNDFLDNPADFQRITEMIDERLYGLFPLDNKD